MVYEIKIGDAIEQLKQMDDESVHCVVTSPPYFKLRSYTDDEREIGKETNPYDFVQSLVEVFREVHRVLKKDGTVWLNLGDTYLNSGAGNKKPSGFQQKSQAATEGNLSQYSPKRQYLKAEGLKTKDLIGIPWRVAFALQEDGWWLRQDIIWNKPNPMPESVRDRCTKAHEYIFLLTKSKKYFYDHEAIKEPVVNPKRKNYQSGSRPHGENLDRNDNDWGSRSKNKVYEKKNKRTVWSIPPKSFKGAHFATFPPKLIEPCVLAGTSEAGHCVDCGSRYKRIVKRNLKNKPDTAKSLIESAQHMGIPDDKAKLRSGLDRKNAYEKNPGYQTLAWEATCDCDSPTEPDVVLDPFMGSGTTAIVARQHGRRFIGIDLNPEYLELADKRICSSE